MEYSYETLGNSSYLVATFENGKGIINYQLQMLANNDIKNILKVSKRQKNDDILVSYNITSKLALSQMAVKAKIPKAGIIKIIEGALNAIDDIAEYQLVSSGMVFDEDYIFIKPGTYEPSFVYLPNSTADDGIEGLKKFLLSLIMGSKVEISNDNFIQVLLETLNKPALTAKDLRKICANTNQSAASNVEVKREVVEKRKPEVINPILQRQPEQPQIIQEEQREVANRPNIPTSIKQGIPEDKKAAKKKEKAEKKSSSPNKTKFVIFQIVFLAVVIAIVCSGVLNNAEGKIEVTYLAGVLMAVACADFVLYRELFVNNKDKEEKSDKTKKNDKSKKVTNKPMAVPGKGKPSMPNIPGKNANVVSAPPKNNIPIKKEAPVTNKVVQEPVASVVQNTVPQAAYVPPTSAYNAPISDFESEDTVVLDDVNSNEAYLEYFENGLSTKIKINKESIIVGKLRGQCDFALNNNKISKIHAEFIMRNGEYFVKDYNSTNGTYINGSNQRIQSNTEYPIFNGDRITLANVDLTFRC